MLIVDDDPKVARLLQRYLDGEGFATAVASDGNSMWRALAAKPADVLLLDVVLPGEDGISLARTLRQRYPKLAIIMVTGKDDPVDRVVGLEVGADDYIAKPFNLREVLARIKAVLRRTVHEPAAAPPGHEQYLFEGWQLDVATRTLRDPSGSPIDLTTMEFALLLVLVRNAPRVMSRDQLMDAVKGAEWTPLDRGIDALISRLRRKLEPDDARPQLIKTVRGAGYVLATNATKA
jgi:two-component system phosphate regulon response regulator OmpR